MPGGPIVVFDKSTLQSFSLDEAVLFDNFYLPVITPLFFVETLADLDKKVREGQTPEEAVGLIAAKTPIMSSVPNVHHLRLVQHELLGHRVPLDRRPLVGQGRGVITGDRRGIMIEQLPEMDSFQRWQDGLFLEIERQYVRQWRFELARWDPGHGKEFRTVVRKQQDHTFVSQICLKLEIANLTKRPLRVAKVQITWPRSKGEVLHGVVTFLKASSFYRAACGDPLMASLHVALRGALAVQGKTIRGTFVITDQFGNEYMLKNIVIRARSRASDTSFHAGGFACETIVPAPQCISSWHPKNVRVFAHLIR